MNTQAKITKGLAQYESSNPAAGAAKRVFDLAFSLGVILCIWPILLIIAVLIKTTSRGPVIFKQKRQGLNGRTFYIYKFRTMKVHEEKAGEVTQAKKNDNRITRIGGILRRTSLDELPQFFNVIQGHMSVVGPRPHALEHDRYYETKVSGYKRRYSVKPGITGWAQVNGCRGETDTIDKMQKRVSHDLCYIRNWGLGLDMKITVMTVFKGLFSRNAY